MSLREDQCKKVCRILDDVLANRPTERDSLIVATRSAFSALYEPHWIPVTEDTLPEGIGRVIAQMDGGAIHDVFYKGKNPYGHVVWVRLDDCIYWDNEVVAWMPLPEPYKGVTE